MSEPRQSPVHDRHVALGAKFAEFGGWLMPLQYKGVVAEHTAVRTAVGVFDVSHLGKVRVLGPGSVAYLNRCLTNDLGKIGPTKAQYTMLCDQDGGVVDDMIAYRFSDSEVLLIPNAANAATVAASLQADAPAGVRVVDEHLEHAILAVQGTNSDETLAALGLPAGQEYLSFAPGRWAGIDVLVCRSGYTGERGYELIVAANQAARLWDAVLAAGRAYDILPCGLGARDTLRTEMGYPLHGHDLGPQISPVAANLGWAVGWDKPEFRGAEALRQQLDQRSTPLLRGLLATGKAIPRPGMRVLKEGRQVGVVTSGNFSPTLGRGIALALLDRTITIGDQVEVQVRDRIEGFKAVKTPFVEPAVRES